MEEHGTCSHCFGIVGSCTAAATVGPSNAATVGPSNAATQRRLQGSAPPINAFGDSPSVATAAAKGREFGASPSVVTAASKGREARHEAASPSRWARNEHAMAQRSRIRHGIEPCLRMAVSVPLAETRQLSTAHGVEAVAG